MRVNPRLDADTLPATVRSLMLGHEWFGSIPDAFQDALIAHGRLRTLTAGEHLFHAESRETGLYCVLGGSISIQMRDRDGHAPVLLVVSAGHLFGEMAMLDRQRHRHDAVALDASQVWQVGRVAIEGWLDAHPIHWRSMARLLAGKLRVAFEVIDRDLRGTMTVRVATRLQMLSGGWGWRVASPSERIAVSQDVLARMMGGSRSSINKALQALQDAGAVRLSYGAIEITDAQRLAAACAGPIDDAPG